MVPTGVRKRRRESQALTRPCVHNTHAHRGRRDIPFYRRCHDAASYARRNVFFLTSNKLDFAYSSFKATLCSFPTLKWSFFSGKWSKSHMHFWSTNSSNQINRSTVPALETDEAVTKDSSEKLQESKTKWAQLRPIHTHAQTADHFFSAEVRVGDMQRGGADHVHDSLLSPLPEADHLLRWLCVYLRVVVTVPPSLPRVCLACTVHRIWMRRLGGASAGLFLFWLTKSETARTISARPWRLAAAACVLRPEWLKSWVRSVHLSQIHIFFVTTGRR